MTATLPNRADLTDTQALLQVRDYSEFDDNFGCTVFCRGSVGGQHCFIPAILIPKLVGEYGEPDEFVGRTFLVQA